MKFRMTKEIRRLRRDMMNPHHHERTPLVVRSKRCRCENPLFDYCHKHGKHFVR